jgi:hypothetical protein
MASTNLLGGQQRASLRRRRPLLLSRQYATVIVEPN